MRLPIAAHERLIRRIPLQVLLKQSEEQETASLALPSIESSDGELVEVIVEVRSINGAMMNTQPPSIEEARHLMDSWHDEMGVPLAENGLRL